MKTKIFVGLLFVLIFLSLISFVVAQSDVVNVNNLKTIAVPIHTIELILAFFICYMSLKFFRITKPVSLFLYIYVAVGFFVINILLFLFFYLSINTRFEIDFVVIYIGSRITLIGMLISFAIFFYQWNKIMRNTNIRKG